MMLETSIAGTISLLPTQNGHIGTGLQAHELQVLSYDGGPSNTKAALGGARFSETPVIIKSASEKSGHSEESKAGVHAGLRNLFGHPWRNILLPPQIELGGGPDGHSRPVSILVSAHDDTNLATCSQIIESLLSRRRVPVGAVLDADFLFPWILGVTD